jgi:DeoR/GlpR family transcriptional regulator of sugar metabolism
MFIEERHRKILEIIRQAGRVEVTELSKLFVISEDSIRRDLRLMEKQGLINRTYGGAVLPTQEEECVPFSERKCIHSNEKKKIGLLASSFIQNNDTILLDGSSTVSALLPFLQSFNGITILTNSVGMANDIVTMKYSGKLIMVGGVVQSDGSTASAESFDMLRQLHVNKVFVGVGSISPDGGIWGLTLEEASLKKAMIAAGKQVFLLASSSKFGYKSLAYAGPVKPEYVIISDSALDKDIQNHFSELQAQGLRIIYS